MLPIATILFGLASVATKVARAKSGAHPAETTPAAGSSTLTDVALEIGGELATVIFAHGATDHIAQLQERFEERLRANKVPENDDLERAIARAATLADLFCLMEAAPEPLDSQKSWLARATALCPSPLQSGPTLGVLTGGDRALLQYAKQSTLARLRDVEEHFHPGGIDPRVLTQAADAASPAQLSADAFAALEVTLSTDPKRPGHPLPPAVADIFAAKWFGYLRLVFNDTLKHDAHVRAIFTILHQEAGFESVKAAIKADGKETRELIEARFAAIQAALAAPKLAPTRERFISLPNTPTPILARDHEAESLLAALRADGPAVLSIAAPGCHILARRNLVNL